MSVNKHPKSKMVERLDNPEMFQLAAQLDNLLRIIECPVCKDTPFPPIYMCATGHNICKICMPKLKECPTCKEKLTKTRNYTVEEIILTFKHSCPYKLDGCRIQKTGELLETHIQNCKYRPFTCPAIGWNNCDLVTLTLSDAKEHFLSVHKGELFNGPTLPRPSFWTPKMLTDFEKSLSTQRRSFWPSNMIEYDGMLFLIHVFFSNRDIHRTVLLIGGQDEAKNYVAKIIIQKGLQAEVQWTIPVESIRRGFELTKHPPDDVFLPLQRPSTFRRMAEWDETEKLYKFCISFTIMKKNDQNYVTDTNLVS